MTEEERKSHFIVGNSTEISGCKLRFESQFNDFKCTVILMTSCYLLKSRHRKNIELLYDFETTSYFGSICCLEHVDSCSLSSSKR